MNRSQIDDIAYFIAFCVEIYKNAHGLSGAQASAVFCECGIYEYLTDNFGILHTQSSEWILEEIEELVKKERV